MDLKSFLTSFGTSIVIFLLLMLLFIWLSTKPRNRVIYYPNRIIRGLDPIPKSRNPVAWIKEAVSSNENDIISASGVDTAVYFVFLSTAFTMFFLAGIVLLPTLLPIAATDHSATTAISGNTTTRLSYTTVHLSNFTGSLNRSTTPSKSRESFNELDQFSMQHVRQGSRRLWAYMLAVYWVSLVTYFLLWRAYKHVSDIRATALMSAGLRAEQFVVLVRDIPPLQEGETRKEQVDSFFKAIYPDTFYKSMIVTDNSEVNKIWKEVEGYKKKVVCAETQHAHSKTIGNPAGIRPTNRTGFLGLWGEKVDTIEYYNEKIRETIPKLEAEQKATLRDKQLSSALVFFSSRVAAASAAQSLHARMVDSWIVIAAPEPRQLIWSNLSLNYYSRVTRKFVVCIFVALSVLFFMVPISFVSAITTLENLTTALPFIKPIVNIVSIRAALEAYLPQLALLIFLALLPKFLMFLSKVEGIPSESRVVRAASGKYFYFTILNVFIGVTLSGSLFNNFMKLKGKPGDVLHLLAVNIPYSSTFFLTYVALRTFIGFGLQLSRLIPFIIFNFRKKFLCKTEAEVKEAWAPGEFGYEKRVPGDMLILTITLCYSVIAPMIIPFGVIYFGMGWLVMRNQALKVYVPSFESYGRMWPHIHNRFIAALIFYQAIMLGYFGVKRFIYAFFIIPILIVSLIFAFVCNKKFYRFFENTALEVVCQETKETPNLEHVYKSFVPPCLSSDKHHNNDQYVDDGDQYVVV